MKTKQKNNAIVASLSSLKNLLDFSSFVSNECKIKFMEIMGLVRQIFTKPSQSHNLHNITNQLLIKIAVQ